LSQEFNRVFVASYLKNNFAQRYFVKELRTVSQPTLNIKQISETPIFLPPLSLQREFANRIEAVEELKSTHCESLVQLDTLFSSLQNHAFRGEL
jgi:type I restriction enzyme S subunit